MTHWSETAMNEANQPGPNGSVDGPVLDCEDRDWEPLAETEDLPSWHLLADIDESNDSGPGSETSGPPADSSEARGTGSDV